MKKMLTPPLAALMSTATLGLATPAAAQQGYYDRDGYSSYYAGYGRDNHRYERYDLRDYRNDRRYDRRNDRRYYRHPPDSSTAGTILGANADCLAGHELPRRAARTDRTATGSAAAALYRRPLDTGQHACSHVTTTAESS